MTYSPTRLGVVPSALRTFTVEFGMGSGVYPSLKPPGVLSTVNLCVVVTHFQISARGFLRKVKNYFLEMNGSLRTRGKALLLTSLVGEL